MFSMELEDDLEEDLLEAEDEVEETGDGLVINLGVKFDRVCGGAYFSCCEAVIDKVKWES